MAESCSNDGGDDDDDDDDADGGGGNSNDDRSVDGDGIFENWCVYGEGGDGADNGDEQTESDVGGLAQCNGSFKMEMTVGVMRCGI